MEMKTKSIFSMTKIFSYLIVKDTHPPKLALSDSLRLPAYMDQFGRFTF